MVCSLRVRCVWVRFGVILGSWLGLVGAGLWVVICGCGQGADCGRVEAVLAEMGIVGALTCMFLLLNI